jgi:hypothetical protein
VILQRKVLRTHKVIGLYSGTGFQNKTALLWKQVTGNEVTYVFSLFYEQNLWVPAQSISSVTFFANYVQNYLHDLNISRMYETKFNCWLVFFLWCWEDSR